VQTPIDVTVILVAELSTSTSLPANNCVLVTKLGLTVPTFAVNVKLGPKSIPIPLFNVTVTVISYNFNIVQNYMRKTHLLFSNKHQYQIPNDI